MRLTLKERGEIWERETVTPYTDTYTQPIFNFLVAWAYHHLYERPTLRIWLWIEKKWPGKFGEEWVMDGGEEVFHVPPTNVQDLRCYNLNHKNRIRLARVLGEPTNRS